MVKDEQFFSEELLGLWVKLLFGATATSWLCLLSTQHWPWGSRTFPNVRRSSRQFNPFCHATICSLFDEPLPSMLDFPCHFPNCNRTFKRQAYLTQHYNAQHRQLSPDSEPDPSLEFDTVYHPKLNGAYQTLFFIPSIYSLFQLFPAIRMAILSPYIVIHHHLLLLMLQKVILGTHLWAA